MSEKQAEALLEESWGMLAYVGHLANPELEIFPTKDRKYAIETKDKAGVHIVIVKETFGEAIEVIKKNINEDQITVKINEVLSYHSEWAKKFKYKVGRD
jgi:hypothetical protein